MRRLLPFVLLNVTGCESFTYEEAQAAYATLDHASVGITLTLMGARSGSMPDSGVVLTQYVDECNATETARCDTVSGSVTGTPELDWGGSAELGGTVTGGGENALWFVDLRNMVLSYQGTDVVASEAQLIVLEQDWLTMADGSELLGTYVGIEACGATVAGHAGVDISYYGLFSLAALTMDSGVDFTWKEEQTLLEPNPNGFRISDDELTNVFGGSVEGCP